MSARAFIYIVALGMFALPGLLAIGISIRGARWFFERSTARQIVERWGFGWARIFYALLGLLMVGAAWLIIADPKGLLP